LRAAARRAQCVRSAAEKDIASSAADKVARYAAVAGRLLVGRWCWQRAHAAEEPGPDEVSVRFPRV
jgi:hypothetical protein